MPLEIKTINFGGTNCFLVKNDDAYVLIDTGYPAKCAALENELVNAGCRPGNLKLVILTHGDIDHTGNCAWLQKKYGVKIAMHRGDLGMAETGNMDFNRKKKSDKYSVFFKMVSLMAFFFKPGKFEAFTPDIIIEAEFSLSEYGFDARIVHLPGHSKGSLGLLTSAGDLFCGDLIYNFFNKPGLICYINDAADHRASIEKLRKLNIKTVYPGHGGPFSMERFMKKYHP
jgi:hydroxyacylglutathione hydrolase